MAKEFAVNFRIKPGNRAHLGKRDPADASVFLDRKAAEQQSAKDGAVINEWQDKLYAEGKRALLVEVFADGYRLARDELAGSRPAKDERDEARRPDPNQKDLFNPDADQ